MDTVEFQLHVNNGTENQASLNSELANEISCSNNVTSFDNITYFLATHKYPNGLNLNQKRTLRKAAVNFSLIDEKLYYIGKCKKDKRLVILDEEGKKQVFEDCHGSCVEGHGHGGQKKTLEKIESLFFWRGMVKDVVTWIQACEVCRLKEERRSQLNKKVKTSIDFSESDVTENCEDAITVGNSPVSLFEAAKFDMDQIINQIQISLEQIQQNEKEVVNMSKKAELDIDDVLDFLLSRIMRLISKKKREMKAQVEENKSQQLTLLKTYRKQFEGRLKAAKKLVSDVEKATRENQSWSTLLNKSVASTLPEIPRREDIGGIWSVFHTDEAHLEIEKIIMSCGNVCQQQPYRISGFLELPASLRLNISNDLIQEAHALERLTPKNLRLYHCIHDTSIADLHVHENQIQVFQCSSPEIGVYLNYLEPRQVYAIYISFREEGTSDWSPWSFPFLASTSIPAYTWDGINSDWHVSTDLRETTKIVDSPTPIYSSSAQYFPGCRISFIVEELPTVPHNDDGFAVIDHWVLGGSLNQEGTIFVNIEGKIFVNGKLVYGFDPPVLGSSLTFDCDPRIETVADGLQMQLTITCHNKSHIVFWDVRNHISNLYFGVRFLQQGARIKIE